MSAFDAMPIILDRVDPGILVKRCTVERSLAVSQAAWRLWQDEMATFEALSACGHHDAARCAWTRRTDAADACCTMTAMM